MKLQAGQNRGLALAALVMAALLGRIAMAFIAEPTLGIDETTYMEVARNCVEEGRYFSDRDLQAYGLEVVRPPLVPWILALLIRVVGQNVVFFRVVFAIVSSLVAPAAFLFARRLGAGWRTAWISALLVSLHPYLLLTGGQLLTESLFPFLLMACMANIVHWRQSTWRTPVWGGLLLGLAAYCRPTILPLLIALPLVWLLFARQAPRWHGCLAMLSATLLLSPWILWLHSQHDTFIPITSSGAYNLWNANNSLRGPDQLVTSLPPEMREQLIHMQEKDRIAFYRQVTRDWIRENPRAFWHARWREARRFWKLVPTDLYNQRISFQDGYAVPGPRQSLIVVGKICWFAYLNVLCLCFLMELAIQARHRPAEMISIAVFLAGITIVHSLMTGDARYRYPVDPLWMSMGLAGAVRVGTGLRNRARTRRADCAANT